MRTSRHVEPPLSAYRAEHVRLEIVQDVAIVTLDRPARKNPLTFESYAELGGIFAAARDDRTVHAFVLRGAGGNFSSGGDVHDIIGPLVAMETVDLLRFTEMTGQLVKAMRACPQPIVAAIDGICAGAGAIMAMASDLRIASPSAKVAFLFNRVGLAGCDMGACAILPRIIGQGRASELLYTGRAMSAAEGERWGFFNRAVDTEEALHPTALETAHRLNRGPVFANGVTKRMLHMEWNMSVDDAVTSEALAQALCMQTGDFRRAYEAFVAKEKPVFHGT